MVLLGVVLIAVSVVLVCLAVGPPPRKSKGQQAEVTDQQPDQPAKRRPWAWPDYALAAFLVVFLGFCLVAGLSTIAENNRRDDEMGKLGCETRNRMYPEDAEPC